MYLNDRDNRGPDFWGHQLLVNADLASIIATEYNLGPTATPLAQAKLNTYGKRVKHLLRQPFFRVHFFRLLPPNSINREILQRAYEYPDGGMYDTNWSGSGTPHEIHYNGNRILSAGDGTYCSGFSFAVVMHVATAFAVVGTQTTSVIRQFQRQWYGWPSEGAEAQEHQSQYALTQLGIGTAIDPKDAVAGDFIQFWRTTSGHSAIFLAWQYSADGTRRIGFRYRGSQGSTNGIGDKVELFSDIPASDANGAERVVDRDRTYLSRLNTPTA